MEVLADQVESDKSEQETKPRLVYFFSPTSGSCRRVDGYLAHVLQRGHNHEVFKLIRVPVEKRPDLAERFDVVEVPTLLVVDGIIRARIDSPRSGAAIREMLSPWLH